MVTYLTNTFSLNMITTEEAVVKVKKIDIERFCSELTKNEIENTINHIATVNLVNLICGTTLLPNRKEVKLKKRERVLVVNVIEKLPEDKVLTIEELINNYLTKGKIGFFEVTVD